MKTQTNTSKDLLTAIIISVASFFLLNFITSCEYETDLKTESTFYIEEAVKSKLKSPSTAEFPYLLEHVIEDPKNTFTVNSHVDAQNSFGGVVRSNFRCTVKYDEGSGKWYMVSVMLY